MPIASEITISYNPVFQPSDLRKIVVSYQAFEIFLDHWDKGQINFREELKIMMLNDDNRVLGIYTASVGGFSETTCDPKIIFTSALLSCATTIILAHNRPSGDYLPSKEDVLLTRQLIKAGKLLDIVVLDHMIITSDFYSSMREMRLIRT